MSNHDGADTKKGFAISGSFLWNGNILTFPFHLQNISYYLGRRKRGQIWNAEKVKSGDDEIFTTWHNITDTQRHTHDNTYVCVCVEWFLSVHLTGSYNKYIFYDSIILARWFLLSDFY